MHDTKSLTARMQDGQCVYGLFVFSPDPAHTELAGLAGFDFVIVDLEHAPLDIGNVLDHVRAAKAGSLSIIVRVANAAPAVVAQLLDAGVAGLVFPHTGLAGARTAEAVAAMRYAPEGNRPACTGVRAAGYGLQSFADYVAQSNAEALSIGLIEDASVIDSLDTILESTGLNMVMPGPGDLAASLGLPGQLSHPRVAAEIDRIVAAVQARNDCTIGAYANSAADAAAWRKRGANLIAYSIDYRIFGKALRKIRDALPD